MKIASTLLLTVALATSAFAGPVDYSKDKTPVVPPPPAPECFTPGFDIGIFGDGNIPSGSSTRHGGLGGGGLVEYFFCNYVGIQASYSASAPEPVHHVYEGDLILRYPIQEWCIAPYLMIGGGGVANSTDYGFFDLGGGVECRVMPHVGLFADGAYHFAGHNHSDFGSNNDRSFTLIRIGLKYAF